MKRVFCGYLNSEIDQEADPNQINDQNEFPFGDIAPKLAPVLSALDALPPK